MQIKKIILSILITIFTVTIAINSYAMSPKSLRIIGEKNNIEIGETVQLKAEKGAWTDIAPIIELEHRINEEGQEETIMGPDPNWKSEFIGTDVTNECSWESSDPTIATVYTNGVVTGISGGTVTITAVYNKEVKLEKTYKITVENRLAPPIMAYKIVYDLDGGINNSENQDVYTIQAINRENVVDKFVLKDPTKEGYNFEGWYLESNFKTKITEINEDRGDITLYAKWSKISTPTDEGNSSNNIENNTTVNETNETTAPTPIPNAGLKKWPLIAIVLTIIIGICCIKKYKK